MQMWEVFIHEREMAERDNLGYCALLRTSEAELKKKIQVAYVSSNPQVFSERSNAV